MVLFETYEDKTEARKQLWRQLRAVSRKYGRSLEMRLLNQKVANLAIILKYPTWSIEYYPVGVYELTLKSLSPKYDYFGIYVRNDGYEVRFYDGFLREEDVNEVRRYLERKEGNI